MVLDPDGALFGTAQYSDGQDSLGVVFKLNPPPTASKRCGIANRTKKGAHP